MIQNQENRFAFGVPVTPSDTLSNRFAGLQVVVAGNLVITPFNALGNGTDGVDITITGAPVGMTLAFECSKVKATGTTATVVGLA